MCLGCGHTDQNCNATVKHLVDAMFKDGGPGYDGEPVTAVYDGLEDQYGPTIARVLWSDACREYDRKRERSGR